ncbi:hypothetical protein JYB87_12060 [Shewanella avicenniae]|uniref:Uracil DNA glycosylase superfamily protein n=1 Tax=Shewanella avicenniae TaxID=2814294 RepID=A0ABX7QND8_9GAMM|nr:hypothetical protein [Shewanella avicenniae]QSX32500.1 hypothetical protein JYB87_12060 [Shewanella avicenniae]
MGNQKLLNDVYEKYWGIISELRTRNPNLSAPILIKSPASYSAQKVKLMIVGQQTKGWGDGDIEELLRCYEDFNFGETYYSSPFWNVTRKIENALEIDNYAIVWSNLNRCDFNDDRPPYELELELRDVSALLLEEINILTPDIVIFFTGPNFDGHIENIFSGSRFESVDGFTKQELSRIVHEALPLYTFRTYHPRYLRLSGMEPRFVEYLENVN